MIKKTVSFNDTNKIYYMRVWSFAYNQARKSMWEVEALDRFRFRIKINKLNLILSPILDYKHRLCIFKSRFSK